MKKLGKRLVLLVSILTICIFIGGNVNADLKKVVDDATLLSNNEILELEGNIKETSSKYNMDIVIVTTNNTEGKSSREYSDDYFDYNGYGYGENKDGILLLINMDDREIYISTAGSGIKYFTDNRINNILDNIYIELTNDNYFEGAKVFLEDVENYLKIGIQDNQYTVDEDGNIIESEDNNTKGNIISILIAFVVATMISVVIVNKYKNPPSIAETTYVNRNSINFTKKTDRFVSTYTTKRKIPKNDSSNGGSTTHTSSSGNSHGGGGRSF